MPARGATRHCPTLAGIVFILIYSLASSRAPRKTQQKLASWRKSDSEIHRHFPSYIPPKNLTERSAESLFARRIGRLLNFWIKVAARIYFYIRGVLSVTMLFCVMFTSYSKKFIMFYKSEHLLLSYLQFKIEIHCPSKN